MISTSLGYHLYGNNIAQSLQRTASEASVTQAQAYYNANIGSVKTVSDLVNNFRLLSYATQAFGLQDMTYAKALLTKVLTSDLSSSTSVANQLNDSRYTAFAKAFGFKTDGTLSTTAQLLTTNQQSDTEALFAANTTLSTTAAAAATTAYKTAIASMTSLSQLEQNPATLGYVLTAYGIDPSTAASTFEQTLESKLSDKTSFVNTKADNGYLALTLAINANADGSAVGVSEAQTTPNVQATTLAYQIYAGTSSSAQTAAATETSYFLAQIGTVTKASDITSNARLLAYVEQAYQLPSNATAANVLSALTSDTTKPTSFANSAADPSYLALAKAFNFATNGQAQTVSQLQTTSEQQATVAAYTKRQTSDDATSQAATAYYNANIGKIGSVAALEADPKLLAYVTKAYGIDPATSTATLTAVMENTNLVANTTKNGSLLALNLDFNIDAQGTATNPLTAQSAANVTATIAAYNANTATDAASIAAGKKATLYYQANIGNVTSVSQLLADPKLVAYFEKANGVPANTTTTQLTQILTSDVTNPKSVAGSLGQSYVTLAASFDFNATGLVGTEVQGAQSKAQLAATNAAYLDQQMEIDASAQNPGIGLALYFQFNASKITDAYGILADRKLTTIFQTMLGISSTTSSADIDAQAKTLTSKINFADLKDPAKLAGMIQRFSIMYDIAPPTSTATYSAASVLTGSATALSTTDIFGNGTSTMTTASLFADLTGSSLT